MKELRAQVHCKYNNTLAQPETFPKQNLVSAFKDSTFAYFTS